MKLTISQKKMPERPRPTFPTVHLTDEAYDVLNELSMKHNISMRQLASNIIIQVGPTLEIEQGGEQDV